MSELGPISKDEAKQALERAAWTETPPESALSACYELACWLIESDGPETLLEAHHLWTKATDRARAAVGDPPRRLVHSFLGRLGADHELAEALALIDEADEVGWVDDPFLGHELLVRAAGRVVAFAVRRPS